MITLKTILGLRDWLTTEEAARHLSGALREDILAADILRFALDGKLSLSVHFVNHTRARRGHIVPIENAKRWELPLEFVKQINPNQTESKKPVMTLLGINIDGKRVLELDDDIVTLDGVYDLPMIGAERLDVEHAFQQRTGGPPVTLETIEGAFVRESDRILYQLQESWDDNEFQEGSRAQLSKLQRDIETNRLSKRKAQGLLTAHAIARKHFMEQQRKRAPKERYYPAGSLPHDSVLVVRTSALSGLYERITKRQEGAPDNLPF